MQITVLQWNVWVRERLESICQFLKENPADVICLQELTRNYPGQDSADMARYLADELKYNYEEAVMEHAGRSWQQVNAILTRFQIGATRQVWINEPQDIGGASDEYRSYLETTLDIEGHKLTVGTAHASFTPGFIETPEKAQETERLVGQFGTSNYIFAGDLNAPPTSDMIESIESRLKHAGPPYEAATWTTKPFIKEDFSETELRWRLDYVFTSPDLSIDSAELLAAQPSDHLPILVKISL